MKLVTWNCQGAFRKKIDKVLELKPDILVVQECEHPDKFESALKLLESSEIIWHGDSSRKGICAFSFGHFKLKQLSEFNPKFRHVLPIQVVGVKNSFTLFAIWAMSNKENYPARYIGQVWLAINHYEHLLKEASVLIGDFNSNRIWDTKKRVGNHSDVVKILQNHKIHSTYHEHFNQEQGKEEHPTFYLQRNKKKAYHIDYCFASSNLLNTLTKVEIGSYENWITHSDHAPLSITFDI